jgi:hypothetical protein
MPKVKCRMISSSWEDGKLIGIVRFDQNCPKAGELCTCKWGSIRTSSQNSLYWLYLNWLIEHGGLKDQGHWDPQALHLDLKAYFMSEKIFDKGQFKVIESEEPTTTDMTKSQFGEYMDKVNEFVQKFFEIDTSAFFEEYRRNYT